MARNTDRFSDFFRLGAGQGTPHTTSAWTASSGFGSTAAFTLSNCTDNAGRVTVACAGTGQGFSPTATLAYVDGTWPDRAPHVLATRGGGSQATINMSVTSQFTTGCIFTFNGTAAGTEQYVWNYWVVG